MELDRMVLPVHEVESGIYRPTVNRAHNLLPARRPLPSTSSLRLEEALLSKPSILAFLADEVASASLQMTYQVFPNYFLRGKNYATCQRKQGPVT